MSSIVIRKLRTAYTNPLAGVRRNLRKALLSWSKSRLRQLGYDQLLSSRPEGAIAPDWGDLWFLYCAVRRRRPEIILEFGSGCSTVILSQALCDNYNKMGHRGLLYSVDADEYWAKENIRHMPEHLSTFARISYSPLIEIELHGVSGFRHLQAPEVTPDFLYLDGPALTRDRRVAVDVLDMERRLPPHSFFMVVDGRREQCIFLAQHLDSSFKMKHNSILVNTVFERT